MEAGTIVRQPLPLSVCVFCQVLPGDEQTDRVPRAPVPSATKDQDGKKHIFINLSKLQTTTMQSLQVKLHSGVINIDGLACDH